MDVVARLRQAGVKRGDFVGLTLAPGVALGLATEADAWSVTGTDLAGLVGRVRDLRPGVRQHGDLQVGDHGNTLRPCASFPVCRCPLQPT